MSTEAGMTLDSKAATDLLMRGINKVHAAELDIRVTNILANFASEQAAGYEPLRKHLRAWTQSHLRKEDIEECAKVAEAVRREFPVFVLVGIGGSDLGGRTLHDSLDHPFHNQLTAEARGGAPEIYFTGDTFDPRRLVALLDLLEGRGLLAKTCFNIVSKSGKTGETISAAMVVRRRLEAAGVTDWPSHVVATTGQNDDSVLYVKNRATPYFGMLPVPDGVGGRFSFASPVGLLPFAVTAVGETPEERLRVALDGYAEAHRRFLLPANDPLNVAASLARWLQLGEQYGGKRDLVFCNYADDSRLGDWFVQLFEESVQERGAGLNVIGTRGPTGNHSILNGILRGPHDKLVLIIRWVDFGCDALIPSGTGIGGDLKYFEGLPYSAVQDASCRATAADYLKGGVPTATITCARRDAYHLFLLMRTLMDAVAIKGRLQNLHIAADGQPDPAADLTYQQAGVEGYKIGTRQNAAELEKAEN